MKKDVESKIHVFPQILQFISGTYEMCTIHHSSFAGHADSPMSWYLSIQQWLRTVIQHLVSANINSSVQFMPHNKYIKAYYHW